MQIKLILAFIATCTAVAALPVGLPASDLAISKGSAVLRVRDTGIIKRQDDDDGDDDDDDDGDDGEDDDGDDDGGENDDEDDGEDDD
ncbi:hypothetical protein N0V90_002909 [Kalmusia sp. IMI 367209]|nr:hypothetical protein N0V90_002909 [Kalmusia sp. IMI 367209]